MTSICWEILRLGLIARDDKFQFKGWTLRKRCSCELMRNARIEPIKLTHDDAVAEVSLYGGQVWSFRSGQDHPVLWMSEKAHFEVGKAIRGGIPVCWPWFGPHFNDSQASAHGFARTSVWTQIGEVVGGSILKMRLEDSDQTRAIWPHAFSIILTITLAESLQLSAQVVNKGEKPFDYTEALHSYFAISNINRVRVSGLGGSDYLDSLDERKRKRQEDETIRLDRECDRIYINTEDAVAIEDEGWERRIVIKKAGSRSTVVWNPWIAKARRMEDFGDDEYQEMVCVESGNIADNAITLQPGDSHQMDLEIRAEPL